MIIDCLPDAVRRLTGMTIRCMYQLQGSDGLFVGSGDGIEEMAERAQVAEDEGGFVVEDSRRSEVELAADPQSRDGTIGCVDVRKHGRAVGVELALLLGSTGQDIGQKFGETKKATVGQRFVTMMIVEPEDAEMVGRNKLLEDHVLDFIWKIKEPEWLPGRWP